MYQYNPFQVGYNFNQNPQPPAVSNIVNDIHWVQGIEGAKAYQVPPNGRTVLLDSEQNRMYIKTCDNIGMCDLRVFDFNEVTTETSKNVVAQQIDTSEFVTKKELNEALQKLKKEEKANEFISTNESHKSK